MKNILYLVLMLFISGCATTLPQQNTILWVRSEAYDYVEKAWKLADKQNYDEALRVSNECISLYSEKAEELNLRCDVNNLEAYEGCQLLNDTAQCIYLEGYVYSKTGKINKIQEICKKLKESYSNSYVVDKCWPWKPAEACDSLLDKK